VNGEAADGPPLTGAPSAGVGAPAPRLQKVLAAAGVASRRKCETLMAEGRVEVDGTVVTQLGARVDPESAVIRVDGRRIPVAHQHVYLVANKPRGVVSSMADESGRPDLSGLLGERPERLFHVGRLDTDTDGLIVLTNDGEFAHRLAHPSYELQKTYVAHVEGVVRPTVRASLLAGVELDDGPVAIDAFKVTLTQPGAAGQSGRSIVEVVLHEGRNRIVRRLLAAVGHPVLRLSRTAIGPIRLHGLPTGHVRELTRDELGTLLDAVGL
jgi:23S rRNA pseudouridine2605 synthase